jgi:hypothetical protein
MQWLDAVQFLVLSFRSDQEVLRWLVLPKSSTFIHILSCLAGKVRRWDLGKSSPTGLSKARSRIWTSMTSRRASSPILTRPTTRLGKRHVISPDGSMKRWPTSFPDGPAGLGGRDVTLSGRGSGRDRDRLCARHIEDGRGQHFHEHQRCLSRRAAIRSVARGVEPARSDPVRPSRVHESVASVLEFMFDTTCMIANMVATGAKKRFSSINII